MKIWLSNGCQGRVDLEIGCQTVVKVVHLSHRTVQHANCSYPNKWQALRTALAPAKADPLAQAEFIDTYRSLKDDLPEGEVVLFLDAAHPTMATKLGYGWVDQRREKNLATTAGKKRINVIGTLNAQTLKLVTTFPETSIQRPWPNTSCGCAEVILEPSFPRSTSFWTKAPIASAKPRESWPPAWASNCAIFPLIHPTLQVDHDAEDDLIESLMTAATNTMAHYLGVASLDDTAPEAVKLADTMMVCSLHESREGGPEYVWWND